MSQASRLDLADIQSGVLRPRPIPFAATYIILRIDDRARRARTDAPSQQRRRLGGPSGESGARYVGQRRAYVSRTQALGVPQASLETFPAAFAQGMAARANVLGDVGESSPEHWEKPLGTPDVHVVITAVSNDEATGFRRPSNARKKRCSNSLVSLRYGVRIVTFWRTKKSRLDSKTASAIRQSKAAAFPEPIPTKYR